MLNETVITEDVILIRINKLFYESMTDEEIYEATRGIWRIGVRKEKADYAFAVYMGFVKEVFEIIRWLPACTLPYRTRAMKNAIENVNIMGRSEFEGKVADDRIRNKYIGKSVKDYFQFGEANPIKYINCN